MKLFKLLEGLYTELKTYNEREAKKEEEKRRGKHSFSNLTPPSHSMTPEYHWIKLQLFQQNISHEDIAQKANCTTSMVSQVICGVKKSKKVESALARILGYATYQDLMEAASAQSKGGAA
jgi:ribosome-binding protein aMBF1 (putative translation factor)